jgi:anaphase-promoting complex subunit 3
LTALVIGHDSLMQCLPSSSSFVAYRTPLHILTSPLLQKAVVDLECLRDSAPEESNVIFQLAKVYRLLGDELRSAQLLAAARDISPKSIGKIRKLLETVKDDEVADEEMDEG